MPKCSHVHRLGKNYDYSSLRRCHSCTATESGGKNSSPVVPSRKVQQVQSSPSLKIEISLLQLSFSQTKCPATTWKWINTLWASTWNPYSPTCLQTRIELMQSRKHTRATPSGSQLTQQGRFLEVCTNESHFRFQIIIFRTLVFAVIESEPQTAKYPIPFRFRQLNMWKCAIVTFMLCGGIFLFANYDIYEYYWC